MGQADRVYLFITILLLIAAIAGGVTLAVQRTRTQPVEIVLTEPAPPDLGAQIYITGAVVSPGIHPWPKDCTLQALLVSAGLEPDADLTRIKIYIPRRGEEASPQKIDINRAEAWLLKALPGIGDVLAQRIVDYRHEYGPFRTVQDLLKVTGIGQATLDKIKDYITVSD